MTPLTAPYYQNLHFDHDDASLYDTLSQEVHNGTPEVLAPGITRTGDVAGNSGVTDEKKPAATRQYATPQQQHIDGNLLEAVTSAAGEQVALDRQQRTAEEAVMLLGRSTSAGLEEVRSGKRKRGDEDTRVVTDGPMQLKFKIQQTPKRQKRMSQSQHEGVFSNTSTQPSTSTSTTTETTTPYFIPENPSQSHLPSSLSSTTPGIHSAAALFRKPTSTAKKYTRPPMSKLFASLQLSPENFLRLQAAAKAYMLDPEHSERLDCVGNRGKGDTDMVKLRLYHSVREFLERRWEEGTGEGGVAAVASAAAAAAAVGHSGVDDVGRVTDVSIGTKFFGTTSEGRRERGWEWPVDADQAIVLCTPLLRRMVTNERQRQYAVGTRKGGPGGSVGEPSVLEEGESVLENGSFVDDGATSQAMAAMITENGFEDLNAGRVSQGNVNTSSLQAASNHVESKTTAQDQQTSAPSTITLTTNPPITLHIATFPSTSPLVLHFSILRRTPLLENGPLSSDPCHVGTLKNAEILAHFDAPASECRSLDAVRPLWDAAIEQVNQSIPSKEGRYVTTALSVLYPTGLKRIDDEKDWSSLLEETGDWPWFNGKGGWNVFVEAQPFV